MKHSIIYNDALCEKLQFSVYSPMNVSETLFPRTSEISRERCFSQFQFTFRLKDLFLEGERWREVQGEDNDNELGGLTNDSLHYFRQLLVLASLFICFASVESLQATNVSCVLIEDKNTTIASLTIDLVTCTIEDTIHFPNISILSRDESVRGLQLSNVEIFYLPINVGESFVNLTGYFANDCAIEEIFRENFKGLESLRYLDLSHNEIDEITAGTFDDLISLEYLVLRKFN
jgi:hypothetical protein